MSSPSNEGHLLNKKQRVASVLKRFQFVDLSKAVTLSGNSRRDFLRSYVARKQGRFSTYEPFRSVISGIYGVIRPLDTTPQPDRAAIEAAVRRACKGRDEGMNVDAALCLYDMVSEKGDAAYDHFPQSLTLAQDRKCFFRLSHYLVRDDEAIFQFPYPRRTRLSDTEYEVMMSLLHYGYVKGDFEHAVVEIADLSCEEPFVILDGRRTSSPRSPRIVRIDSNKILSRDDLKPEIENVYHVLLQIAEEPDDT